MKRNGKRLEPSAGLVNTGHNDRAPITVLIADDERLARDRLRAAVHEMPCFTLVSECEDGLRAVQEIEARRPDLVLLDVEMPGLDGFGVVRKIRADRVPAVIFVTAFDDYAVRAFEARAIDYILKPFENARVRAVLDRAREQIELQSRSDVIRRIAEIVDDLASARGRHFSSAAKQPPVRLTVRENERVTFVAVSDIDWIESDGNYVRIHVGRRDFRIRDSLLALADRLDPQQFARIHKSTMVNIDRIAEVQPWFGGDYVAILRDGKQLRVSRTFAPSLLKSR